LELWNCYGMGAQLSVVMHTVVFVLGLLIVTFMRDLKIVVSLLKKRIRKGKENKFGFEHCVRIEFGSLEFGIAFRLDFYFFAIAPLFPLVLELLIHMFHTFSSTPLQP